MSISQNFADSYIAFESLRAAVKDKEKHHGETMAIIAGEFDKYTVWADKSGAARSGKDFRLSLDYQLREASFYKDQVVKLLQNLQQNTEKALSLLSNDQKDENDGQTPPNDTASPEQKEPDRVEGEPGKAQDIDASQAIVVEGQGLNKAAESTEEVEAMPTTKRLSADFWKLMSSINSTITTLEKVPVRNRDSINEIKDDELEGGIAREHFDILHVRDKLPDKNLDPKVITRLGKMITRRRQLLLSLRSRRDEFRMSVSLADASVPRLPKAKAAVLDAPPNTAATENFDDHGQTGDKPLPSIRDSVLFAPSEPHSISGSSTPPGSKLGKQRPRIPPRPRNSAGLGMTRFECKYCFMTPYIPSDTAWKNHILRDLQPYVCTFASCSLVDRVFENRDAWWEHEVTHHRSQFYCNTPGHARYRDQAAFKAHMRDEHNADLVQPELLARFRRPMKSPGGKCNLCSLEARDLKRHVARHLEQLALFSIPRSDFDEGDGSTSRRASLNRDKSKSTQKHKSLSRNKRDSKNKEANNDGKIDARENVDSLLEELIEAKSLETDVIDDDDDDSTTSGTGSTVGHSPKDTATTQSLMRRSESRSESPIPVPINTPYKRVGVLMFVWSDPRPATSFFDLEHTLRCRYRFDVRVEEIPTDGDVSQYFTRGVSDLIRDFRGRSDLMIIYYAGRARFLSRSQDLEFRSNRDFFEFDVPCASMSWKLIESKLLADNNVKSDVLAVLEDSAAIDFASGNEISQILETPDVHAPSSASSTASSDNSGEEKRDRCFQFLTMRRTTPYPQASFTEAMNQVLLDSTSGIDASDLAYHMTLQNEYGHATRNPCYVFHRLNPPGRDIAIAPLPASKENDELPLPEAKKTIRLEWRDDKTKLSKSGTEVKTEQKGEAESIPASPAPSSTSVSNHPLVLMAKQVTLKPFVWPAQFNPYSPEYVSIPRTNPDRLLVPEPASRSSPSPIGRVASDVRGALGPVVERKHFSLLHPRFPFRHQRDQREQQERKQQIQASQLGSFKFDQLPPSKQDQTPPKRLLPRRRKPNVPIYENDLDLPSTLSLSLSLPTPTLSLPGSAIPHHPALNTYDGFENHDDAAPGPTIQRRRPSPTFLSRRNTIASSQFFDSGMYTPQQPRRLSRATMNHVRSSSQGNQSRTLTLNPRNTDTRSIILDSTDDYLYGGYVANEDLEIDESMESAAPAPQIPTHITRPRRSASRSSLQLISNSLSRHGSFSRRRPLTANGSTPSLASTVASMLGPAPGPIYNSTPRRNDRATSAPAPIVPLSQPEPATGSVFRSPEAAKSQPHIKQNFQKEHQSLKRSTSMSLHHSLSLRRSITGSLRRSATLIGVVGSASENTALKAIPSSSPPPAPATSSRLESNQSNINSNDELHGDNDNLTTKSRDHATGEENAEVSQDPAASSSAVEAPASTKSLAATAESTADNRISVIAPLPHIPSFPILASSSRATMGADISSIPLPPAPDDANGDANAGLRRSPWGSMRRGRSLRRSISGLFSAGGGGPGKPDKAKHERGEPAEFEGSAEAGAAETKKQKRARSQSRASRNGPHDNTAIRDSGVLAESSGNRGGATGVEGDRDSSAADVVEKDRPDSGDTEMMKKAKKKRSRAELWAGFRAGVSRRGR